MGLGATNKRKGSYAERYYANFFKSLGYSFCKTSRFASKQHDNAKIDLMFIPFNIQVKAGKQKGLNPSKELHTMNSAIKAMFPTEDIVHNKPCLLIHYRQGTSGVKRKPEDEMLYMSLQQFESFKEEFEGLTFTYKKVFKLLVNSEYRDIVGMTVEHFKDEVILKM